MHSFYCVRDCAAQCSHIIITIKIEDSIKAHSYTVAITLLSTNCVTDLTSVSTMF